MLDYNIYASRSAAMLRQSFFCDICRVDCIGQQVYNLNTSVKLQVNA